MILRKKVKREVNVGIEAIHQLDAIQNYLEDFKAIEADLSERR